ncbi:N-acyl-L-amino acid amidohydrolase [Xanthomonas phaseoli pv. phaseoli]|uniref:Metal-dependent amidase/aminoacylase/carboxypeptidase n=1 Tax=Xanthomonas campestris pv. phaseoli TaxID=317013 RepID=A0AB38E4P7_XANCH|nr:MULTISPECIES: M20 family metallopeptidase [Xanthomonas]ATS22711.1 amidohydrolase [Xanthomonas phaseoli pv. phaseoli]ATS25616.1 amidohydrolase [Xanthomonas phaseoli pv. phaseoli]ATS30880.1 amidohydrolase [Xanthomonas phaseoli pv. phaseoli]ATS33868.1 amidohydrolase [Xanthomonas phaseoli pv. phaseoli]AZU14832.1 N-acyl-L-amino acid amidohydrolase [Xanthomonas phaseoli pv. phaseoli]
MRPSRLLTSALLLALPTLATAQTAQTAQRPEVQAAAAPLQAKVVQWRRDFHQHPELSNREERTAATVAAQLRKLGLKPRTGIAHHGVVAIIKGGKPGPKIALRADMDALPVTEQTGLPFASKATAQYRGEQVGVMHACGHDAHTAILLGVAEALVGMREQLPGEVMLIFQPSEEGAPGNEEGGASLMLKEGLFADFKPQAVFGLHVFSSVQAGKIAVRSGPLMAASDRFAIKMIGRQTHGSAPWNGIDPIVASADMIGAAQTVISRRANLSKQPAVLSFGAIKGGIRYNIIPDDVEMVGTIRTFDEGMRQQIFADLKNVAEHTAAAHGAKVDAKVPDQDGNPATVNDPALTAKMLPSLQAVVGADNVYEPPLQMGAEDFSFYAQQVPSMFFFVGSTAKGIDPATAPSNHSPQFLLDESSLDVGLRALLQVSLDYLQQG